MSESTLENPAVNGASSGLQVRSVFISSPETVDTRTVRCALERRGVRCFSADQVDLPGESIPQILREGMGRADLVVAVVDDTAASNLVFYEIGFAQALNKPLAVLLLADAPGSAWIARGVPSLRYRPEVPDTLDFSLDQILKIPCHGGKPSPTATRRSQPIGVRADEFLAQLRSAGENLRQPELEKIIAQAIRESGVATVSPLEGDQGVDLVVWSDDLAPWVGYPLPIELRLALRKADLNGAVVSLAQAMARGGMNWGLLLYLRTEGDVTGTVVTPNIIPIPVEQFLEQLRTTGFGDMVLGLRNQRVHGSC